MNSRYRTAIAVMLFASCMPIANFMISNIGMCVQDGPCVVPVGFGLYAPSGVIVIGVGFVLRDYVHETAGLLWSAFAIALGAYLSAMTSSPRLVMASVAAFMIAEFLDLAVYAPLRRRGLAIAVAASGAVGAATDSLAFLWIAFGRTDFVGGQLLGKLWATIAASSVIAVIGWRRATE